MHEGRIAQAVAAEIRERGLDGRGVRLVVSGGHGDATAFEAALRLHLAAALPQVDVAAISIVHRPAVRLCGGCGGAFVAPRPTDDCPACGGEGVAIPTPERIDLEWGPIPGRRDAGDLDAREEA
jgi:Zn finger protein HypA/HybF involved in hydrogenase expression